MKINLTINIEKKHFYFLIAMVAVLFVIGVSAYKSYQQPSVFGHSDDEIESVSAGKIKPGTFGKNIGDESKWYFFAGTVGINKSIILDLTAANVTAGNATILNDLFFPSDVSGIFLRTNTRNPSSPHIDYSDSTGLWVSSGAGSGKPVYIEGGDVMIQQGNLKFTTPNSRINSPSNLYLDSNNVRIQNFLTLGGVSKNQWPSQLLRGDWYIVGPACDVWLWCADGYYVAAVLADSGCPGDRDRVAAVCAKIILQ